MIHNKNTCKKKKKVLLCKNHAGHIDLFRHAVFGLCLQHNELLSKPALRGEHPVFRGDGLSGSIEVSVAMHGVFLYAVFFFNGFLAALGPGEGSLSLFLFPSQSPFISSLVLSWRTSALFSLLAGVVSFSPRASISIALALFAASSSACLLPRHRCPLLSFSPR